MPADTADHRVTSSLYELVQPVHLGNITHYVARIASSFAGRLRHLQRLGIYIDAVHRAVKTPAGNRTATDPADYAFIGVFLPEVGRRFDSVLIFGRSEPAENEGDWGFLPQRVELVELPYYADLRQIGAVARAVPGTAAAFWKALDRLDLLLLFGPHPFSLLLAGLAALRGKQVVLGVRQDTVAYFKARGPTRSWTPRVAIGQTLDVAYRLVAKRAKIITTGPEIGRHYGAPSRRVHVMTESVVRSTEIPSAPALADWSGEIRMLTVGRLDPEKNPLLLVELMARLEREVPGRFRLTWVGGGPMEDAIRGRARELDVASRIDFRGWIPFGPEVLALYRASHMFVHVSFTEGVPKVLVEALASAIPIVATDVGGVRELLDGGRAGLLVEPADLEALFAAVTRVATDVELRHRLVRHGLDLASERTLDVQAARVADFLLDVETPARGVERPSRTRSEPAPD